MWKVFAFLRTFIVYFLRAAFIIAHFLCDPLNFEPLNFGRNQIYPPTLSPTPFPTPSPSPSPSPSPTPTPTITPQSRTPSTTTIGTFTSITFTSTFVITTPISAFTSATIAKTPISTYESIPKSTTYAPTLISSSFLPVSASPTPISTTLPVPTTPFPTNTPTTKVPVPTFPTNPPPTTIPASTFPTNAPTATTPVPTFPQPTYSATPVPTTAWSSSIYSTPATSPPQTSRTEVYTPPKQPTKQTPAPTPINFKEKNQEIKDLTSQLNDYAIESKKEVISQYDLPKETFILSTSSVKKSFLAKPIIPNKANLWCVPKKDASFTIKLDEVDGIIHSFTLGPGPHDSSAPQKISVTIESKDGRFNYVFDEVIEKGEKHAFTLPYYVKATTVTVNVLENYGAEEACLENFDVYGPEEF